MALTGGHETRLLLASSRAFAHQAEFFCLADAGSVRDQMISKKLAQSFKLSLRVIPFPRVSDVEAQQWMARTGYCAGEHRFRFKGVQQLNEFDYRIGGTAGEVGRGFFWRHGDGYRKLTANELYDRLGLPSYAPAEQAVADWFTTLPTVEPLLQLDLAYLELRLSCWFAPQTYGSVGSSNVYPMISREVFTRMLELPADWRRGNKWILEVIQAFWPELLSVPINNLGWLRERLRLIQRALEQPSLVKRRLLKRFN